MVVMTGNGLSFSFPRYCFTIQCWVYFTIDRNPCPCKHNMQQTKAIFEYDLQTPDNLHASPGQPTLLDLERENMPGFMESILGISFPCKFF